MVAFSVVFILVAALFPGVAAAHGNVALEDDICVRRVGGNLVHFNAYQPQHEAKAQYCTEIPGEGDTFLVLDLVDPVLRTLPVGVRVVRGTDGLSEEQTVAYWPPVTHPDGVLRGEANLSKGLYTFVIMPEGFSHSSYLLRVQQADYGKISQKAVGPLMILLLLALIGYEISKSRRWGGRRAPGRS
ncbi:hypothetical protein [Candidatus Nitrospira inopinata]|jgi:hypothetical protein|uniref:Uncharacterized protein n=1 Tax=Candidatus Nitrospira inopinata TaxID=1715989 RepID=A0A0S4KSC3_9BACT|nr:hypothetical protein [Candidatus Nitrospira inopinata]CUQ66233.1 conserved exported protein of unknown function, putative AmoE2 [Candidatus Nitrospira inopinata]